MKLVSLVIVRGTDFVRRAAALHFSLHEIVIVALIAATSRLRFRFRWRCVPTNKAVRKACGNQVEVAWLTIDACLHAVAVVFSLSGSASAAGDGVAGASGTFV